MSFGVLIKYAYDKDKNFVSIDDASKKEVYYCTNCGVRVFVREGKRNVKHFSHPQNKTCFKQDRVKRDNEIDATLKKKPDVIEHNVKIDEDVIPIKVELPKPLIKVSPKAKIVYEDIPTKLVPNQELDFVWNNLRYSYARCMTANYNLHINTVVSPDLPPQSFVAGVWNKPLNQEILLGQFENRQKAQKSCEDYVKKDYAVRQGI